MRNKCGSTWYIQLKRPLSTTAYQLEATSTLQSSFFKSKASQNADYDITGNIAIELLIEEHPLRVLPKFGREEASNFRAWTSSTTAWRWRDNFNACEKSCRSKGLAKDSKSFTVVDCKLTPFSLPWHSAVYASFIMRYHLSALVSSTMQSWSLLETTSTQL